MENVPPPPQKKPFYDYFVSYADWSCLYTFHNILLIIYAEIQGQIQDLVREGSF